MPCVWCALHARGVVQAATFGTPFGGVLFSIEVTATCYMVRNLPRAFLTAVCASLVYNMVGRDVFALFKETGDRVGANG